MKKAILKFILNRLKLKKSDESEFIYCYRFPSLAAAIIVELNRDNVILENKPEQHTCKLELKLYTNKNPKDDTLLLEYQEGDNLCAQKIVDKF